MNKSVGFTASILATLAIMGTPSRVSAQSVQASPVRACIIRYLQTQTATTCSTLEAFRQEIGTYDECRGAPIEPLSHHFCGVCLVTANRVPTGCDPYLETAPAPWTPPAPTSSPVIEPAPVVAPTVQVMTVAGGAPVVLTGPMACTALGGFWDSNVSITMERGRVQHGYCFTPEMQAFARAQFGMADTTPPDQVLARIRSNGYVHESRLQEVAAAAEARTREAIAAEASQRQTAIGELAQNQLQIGRIVSRERVRMNNFRRNFGLDLNVFGGGSAMMVNHVAPIFVGLGADFVLPIGTRVAGVFGAGLGAGFPLDAQGMPSFQFFERVGVRYYHAWELYANENANGSRRVVGGASPGLGGGVAAYQLLSAHDLHMHAQMFGAYLEGFVSFAVGPARLRVGLMGIVGAGSREVTETQSTGLMPDMTILGTIGSEFRL